MKKHLKHTLKTASLGLVMGLATLVIDGGQMGTAEAGIRVRARVQTPHGSVEFRNGPHHVPVQQKRVTRPFMYRVTKQDRQIANRLARVTGHRKGNLLELRRRGLGWRQIGLRLQIPRHVVRNAIHGVPPGAFRLKTCGNRWR